jgi:Rrf2 family iron-sulfur cluster assembly transcriptional regulator
MLSRACQIGIRASVYLTLRSGATFVNTREISDVLNESHHFVAKVLHQLASGGLLRSYRGPNGGVGLSKDSKKIYLVDIISIIDGRVALDKCVLGRHDCSDKSPCPLHSKWSPIRKQILSLFQESSLHDVATRIQFDKNSDDTLKDMLSMYLRKETLNS